MKDIDIKFMMTAAVNQTIENNKQFGLEVVEAYERFNNKDWGIVPEEDKQANDQDLSDRDGHVLARYKTSIEDIYINMEFYPNDENYALIMFVDEY